MPTAASAAAPGTANDDPTRAKYMAFKSEAGLRCAPQILDDTRFEYRVAHAEKDDDGDAGLKKHV
jgi:hypothetical protein